MPPAHTMSHESKDAMNQLADIVGLPADTHLRRIALSTTNLAETPAVVACNEVSSWQLGSGRGCLRVVGGPSKTGKTVAAAHCAMRAARSDERGSEAVRFVTARDLVMDELVLSASFKKRADGRPPEASTMYELDKVFEYEFLGFPASYGFREEARGRIKSYGGAELLVIDDMGKEPFAPNEEPYSSSPIVSLIERRIERGDRTLVTTSLSRKEFARRYLGGRLTSRLFMQGTTPECTVVRGDPPAGHEEDMRWDAAVDRYAIEPWLPWFVWVAMG